MARVHEMFGRGKRLLFSHEHKVGQGLQAPLPASLDMDASRWIPPALLCPSRFALPNPSPIPTAAQNASIEMESRVGPGESPRGSPLRQRLRLRRETTSPDVSPPAPLFGCLPFQRRMHHMLHMSPHGATTSMIVILLLADRQRLSPPSRRSRSA